MKYYKRFEPVGKYWLEQLECYNEGPFHKKYTDKRGTQWSIGQVYEHLTHTAIEIQLEAIRQCIAKENGATKGKKTFMGWFTFLIGKYFPGRQKTASHHKINPSQRTSIKEMQNSSIKVLKMMSEYSSKVDKMSKEDLKYKIKHPKFGALNAREWYLLVIMHYQHHLKQKYKIDNMLMQR
ncbi:MAG: DinB family protein [Cytophagales bacterium]|nr:DinB family protein [Cytophagales bacterium]